MATCIHCSINVCRCLRRRIDDLHEEKRALYDQIARLKEENRKLKITDVVVAVKQGDNTYAKAIKNPLGRSHHRPPSHKYIQSSHDSDYHSRRRSRK